VIITTNIHSVKRMSVSSYNHDIHALNIMFHIDDGSSSISQVTAFGIKPKEAMTIMSILGDDATRIYINNGADTLSRDQYMEEITVREVFTAIEGEEP
jgi:ABC-type transport system involved in Fe-S cluster assembly fused permease/ATPase subunit